MVITSAPGKILWIGGYSVLEQPNTSLVGAINKRVYVKVKENNSKNFKIESKQLNEKWEGNLENEKLDSPLNFVYQALKCTINFLNYNKVNTKGIVIQTYSDSAFSIEGGKSGLGSSAAVTTATVASILEYFEGGYVQKKDIIHKIAQVAHSLAQGKVGSGFDVAACTYGSCIYSRYDPKIIENKNSSQIQELVNSQWDYSIKPIKLPEEFRLAFGNFILQSAKTSDMVRKVMELKKNSNEEYKKIISKINLENEKSIVFLKQYENASDDNTKKEYLIEFLISFNNARILTKQLGILSGTEIESDLATQLIEESKKHGAFVCKLPGAGGMDSIVALCKNEEAKNQLEEFWKKYLKLKILPIDLENEMDGIKLESEAEFIINKSRYNF